MKYPNNSRLLRALVCRALLPACAALLICLAGCSKAPEAEPAEASLPTKPVPVEAVKAERLTLRPALDLIGTIVAIPERTAVVSSQLGGWVERVEAVEGQHVYQGDKLVLLDARSAEADVERTKAVVAEKQAVLARLKRGSLPEEVEAARQDRDKARAAMEGFRAEASALDDLRKRNEVSKVQWESRQKALEQARAALASAEARLKLVEAGSPREIIDEAQAFLAAAKADLQHAQLTVGWCTVTSPIEGVVVHQLARQGQFFDRAAPLATIMDLSQVFVQLRIPSAEFMKIHVGTPVDAEIGIETPLALHGAVSRISGDAEAMTGNVIVFADLKNDGGRLRPGMSCHAQVWLPEITRALAIPVAAVADHDGTPVATVIRNGQAHEVTIKLGARTPELVQVIGGIADGDIVATLGGYGLPDGCPVQIVKDLGERQAQNP